MTYNAIYLSPHLDDAALSCGGQIYERTQRGERVLIVTIAAGDAPAAPLSELAQLHHDRWQLGTGTVQQRREEDIAACRILGADYRHWSLPDCIYRRHPQTNDPLYTTLEAIFGPVHEAERPLVTALAQQMAALPPAAVIFPPLAVGRHVDHQLTRQAAEICYGRSTLPYYEDYPYVAIEGTLDQVIPPDDSAWQPRVIPLSDTALNAKYRAITAFASQLSTFFRDQADLEAQVGSYAAQVGGERVWHFRGR
ncbi:MAG: PIG-L family deacetylase [Chloroflexota bacterium]|jgi:LmbE family N-acetylglucosaminyl deacetylase